MTLPTMLSSHCIRRDHNGLPEVVRKRKVGFAGVDRTAKQLVRDQDWNASHRTLCSVVESLRSLFDRIEFLEAHVLHKSIRANSPGAPACIKAIPSINSSLVEDEITRLQERDVLARQRFEEILGITRAAVEYLLQDIPDALPDGMLPWELRQPRTLIRIFTESSHTSYNTSLGFCCSKWKKSKSVAGLLDIQKDNELFRQGLRNHCEGNNPSDWISLIDNIPGAMDFIEKWKFDRHPTCHIALVSIAKLKRLNIVCDQSNNLVNMAGSRCYDSTNPTGVQYAWSSHYLVREWIPAECICRVFGREEFLRLCVEHNFQKGR